MIEKRITKGKYVIIDTLEDVIKDKANLFINKDIEIFTNTDKTDFIINNMKGQMISFKRPEMNSKMKTFYYNEDFVCAKLDLEENNKFHLKELTLVTDGWDILVSVGINDDEQEICFSFLNDNKESKPDDFATDYLNICFKNEANEETIKYPLI